MSQPVAIVTGSGRGIGRGIAVRLAADGYQVAINALSEGGAKETKAEIEAAGGTAEIFLADIGDLAAHEAFVSGIVARFGRIDLLGAMPIVNPGD